MSERFKASLVSVTSWPWIALLMWAWLWGYLLPALIGTVGGIFVITIVPKN